MQTATYRFAESQPHLDSGVRLCWAMTAVLCLITLGLGLWWLGVPGIDAIVLYGEDKMALFWPCAGLTVAAGLATFALSLWRSPARNFLELDDVGLTSVLMGFRRRWPWRDLESVAVRDRPLGMKVAEISVPGKTVTLPDLYEAPIEDIADKLAAYRDEALGAGQGAKATAAPPRSVTPGQPVSFAKSRVKYRQALRQHYLQLLFGALAVFASGSGLMLYGSAGFDQPWALVGSILAGLAGLLGIGAFHQFRRIGTPERNRLDLGADGLTYLRRGERYSWPWRDLSAFEHQVMERSRFPGRNRVVTFTAPGDDRLWRLLRKGYGLPEEPRALVIEDVYETPLEEIAATLNAHRRHASETAGV